MPESTPNQVPRARVQTLSDLVFGLTLSIGALALINQQPRDLSQLSYSLFAFAFSFLILVNVWYRYSTIMSVLPVETSGLIVLNLLMLFFVSVEPYLLNLLIFQTSTYTTIGEYASIFYAFDIAGLNLIVATRWRTRKSNWCPESCCGTIGCSEISCLSEQLCSYYLCFLSFGFGG